MIKDQQRKEIGILQPLSPKFSDASTVKIDSSAPFLFKIDKLLTTCLMSGFRSRSDIEGQLSEIDQPYSDILEYLIIKNSKENVSH